MNPAFVTIHEVEKFNLDVVEKVITESENVVAPIKFDPNKYDSFIVSSDDLDDQVLYGIVDLCDNAVSAMNPNTQKHVEENSPNTVDKINASLMVAYITLDGIPVAAAVLKDPTKENFTGIIPGDYYEMRTGISLEGRLEQDYFEVHPDYTKQGLASELRRLISTVVDDTYIVVSETDENTITGITNAGYKYVSHFKNEWDEFNSMLWIS